MTRSHLVVALFLLLAGWPVQGRQQPASTLQPIQPDLGRLADGQGAQVFNRSLTTQKEADRTAARLDARAGDGGALIDGVQLGEGVIEVDLRGKDVAQQSFLGIAFHVVDWTTYDAVYFRPFNFRAAGQEQRSHSVQYISHPLNTWQKLRAERPGQFERAIDPPPDPNAWFHARIVLANSKVAVYVNRATAPSLVVDDLGEAKSGGVALWAGNGSDGAYASLTITPTAPPGPPPASRQTVFQAAATGNLARLRTLAEADASAVNLRTPNGLTPLHLAAANDQRQAAEYLISKGADVNAVARHSGTPLDLAYESERPEIVRWLESKGGRFTPLRFDVATLTPAIHRVAFPWGMMNNVLVFSGADGAVIVDSGFSTRALEALKKEIARFSPSGVRYVINSHNHGDHVTGNALAPGAAAVITSATLAAPPAGLSITRQTNAFRGRSGRTLPAGYTWRTGGADLILIPRPGLHSDADVIVYFPKESVVAMGDLLLSESMPAVNDIPAYMVFLDDVLKDYKAKYSLLDFLAPDTLIPRVVTAVQKGTLK